MANPYDINFPGKFEITYTGFSNEFYCFRLGFEDQKGFDSCVFQMEVSQWLFEMTQGEWFMGNEFPYPDHPAVSIYNPRQNDYFVLFQSLADVAMFEHKFMITGLSPTMLV